MVTCQQCKIGSCTITSVSSRHTLLRCERCRAEREAVRGPVFFVGGPSGSGKTTTMHLAMQRIQDVVHLDADLIYGISDDFETPEDDYARLSRVRLLFAWSLLQSGRPVVLWGAGTPDQTLARPERELFSDTHFLSLVCDDDALLDRLRSRHDFDRYTDEFVDRTLDYLRYLRDPVRNQHAELLDTSALTPEQTSDAVDAWIRDRLARS